MRRYERPISAVEDVDEGKPWEAYYRRNRSRISDVEQSIGKVGVTLGDLSRRVGNLELRDSETSKAVANIEKILIGVQAALGHVVAKLDGQSKSNERTEDHRVRWYQLMFAALLGAALSLATRGIKC